MVAFHTSLSEQSVYFRFFAGIPLSTRIQHDVLTRACFIDYDCAMALVAEKGDEAAGAREIIGVGRLTKLRGRDEAEFAVAVGDSYQGLGLGTELLGRLLGVGKDEKLRRIVGEILPENQRMQAVCKRLGFSLRRSIEAREVMAEITL